MQTGWGLQECRPECRLAPAPEREAVVTRVLSNREEGFGPEVDFYFSYWVEAQELSETEVARSLLFERGTDGNPYLDGCMVSITLLNADDVDDCA